jgi:ferredoxin
MTYVIVESCIKCKYTDCVEICPVDCFHEGPNYLVIDPEECIDCSLCEPECPVDAIMSDNDVPVEQLHFLKLNADLSADWPVITQKKPAPADADVWADREEKLQYLER